VNLIKSICLLFFLVPFGYSLAQNNDKGLIGRWEEKPIDPATYIECPYKFSFEKDKRYKILNVCGALDPRMPVVEDGTWMYDPSNRAIKLSQRKPHNAELFHNSNSILVLKIIESTDDYMIISLELDNNEVVKDKLVRSRVN
jgi:hypothetical protein